MTKQHTPMTPKERRAARDIILVGMAISILGRLAPTSKLFKDLKPLAKTIEGVHRELKTNHNEAISIYPFTTTTFNAIAEKLLETTDDRTLTQAFNYIDALNTGDVLIVSESDIGKLKAMQPNDTK